jgi:hypothetical protein
VSELGTEFVHYLFLAWIHQIKGKAIHQKILLPKTLNEHPKLQEMTYNLCQIIVNKTCTYRYNCQNEVHER